MQVVLAEQAGFLELPHARACCTTEACKILLLISVVTEQHLSVLFSTMHLPDSRDVQDTQQPYTDDKSLPRPPIFGRRAL